MGAPSKWDRLALACSPHLKRGDDLIDLLQTQPDAGDVIATVLMNPHDRSMGAAPREMHRAACAVDLRCDSPACGECC